ncbi:MAG: hypothetical protein JNK19_01990 [Tabrizicola sp.]|nr:hypothetical protein [Tabrizicola sp.]
MQITRRAALPIAFLSLLSAPTIAASCMSLLPGLAFCGQSGWELVAIDGDQVRMAHDGGLTAEIRLRRGLSAEDMQWESCMAAHAPISARAQVLSVQSPEISGRIASTTAYLPRHLSPAAVIALTSYQGDGLSLVVTTRGPGDTYSDPHQRAHAALLAALKLDPPE